MDSKHLQSASLPSGEHPPSSGQNGSLRSSLQDLEDRIRREPLSSLTPLPAEFEDNQRDEQNPPNTAGSVPLPSQALPAAPSQDISTVPNLQDSRDGEQLDSAISSLSQPSNGMENNQPNSPGSDFVTWEFLPRWARQNSAASTVQDLRDRINLHNAVSDITQPPNEVGNYHLIAQDVLQALANYGRREHQDNSAVQHPPHATGPDDLPNPHQGGRVPSVADNEDDSLPDDAFEVGWNDPRWNFRSRAGRRIGYAGDAYEDNDETGDYGRRVWRTATRGHKRQRSSPSSTETKLQQSPRKKARTINNLLAARQRGECFTIILRFQSRRSLKELANFWRASATKLEKEKSDRRAKLPGQYRMPDIRPHNLRHRCGRDDEEEIPNLKGHPEGRGCKPCYELGQPCSLLQPGATYPCTTCSEDCLPCQLLVEPPHKRCCEQCKNRRWHCTYLDPGTDHSLPCGECSWRGFPCVAGPAIDPTRVRLLEDGKPALKYPPHAYKKRASTCEQCRQDNLKCSLSIQHDGPCTHCLNAGFPCVSISLRMRRERAAARRSITPNDLSPPDTLPDPTVNCGSTNWPFILRGSDPHVPWVNQSTEIVQQWAEAPPDSGSPGRIEIVDSPCLWCTAFPITWQTTASSIHNPIDLTINRARPLCLKCANRVSRIKLCSPRHVMQPIPDLEKYEMNRRTLMGGVVNSKPGTPCLASMARFCSVCCNVAHVECINFYSRDPERKRQDQEQKRQDPGCGLRLCKPCDGMLKETHDNLSKMVHEMKNLVNEDNPDLKQLVKRFWPRGIRADAFMLVDKKEIDLPESLLPRMSDED